MKSLVSAIVLACALVSFGRKHEVSTMYKSTPAIVGAIWSDCSEWQATSPTLLSLQPSLYACSYCTHLNLFMVTIPFFSDFRQRFWQGQDWCGVCRSSCTKERRHSASHCKCHFWLAFALSIKYHAYHQFNIHLPWLKLMFQPHACVA